MPQSESVQAFVQSVITDGKHGPYAVTSTGNKELGSITFALDGKVWVEEDFPEPGEIVFLSKLRLKRAGWKAMEARRIRPSN